MLTYNECVDILDECRCEPYQIGIYHFKRRANDEGWYLQVRKWRKDVDSGDMGWGNGAKLYVSPYSTPEELRQKALGACIAYAEHEVREAFTWRGRQIFGPHMDHDLLWEAASKKVKRKDP